MILLNTVRRLRLTPALIVTLIMFVPPAVIGALTLRYWVNVPLFDEWDTPGNLFRDYFTTGHLDWAKLFAQHNDSRMVFPKLTFLGAAKLTGWDTRVPMVLVWSSALAMLLELRWLIRRTVDATPMRQGLVAVALALLLFSTNQWESWLWGIQLSVFLPPLCLITALVLQRRSRSYPLIVLGCAALSFISTFSNANGMLCWLLALPLFGGRATAHSPDGVALEYGRSRRQLVALAVYFILMIASLLLYFHGYARPSHHPGYSFAILHPVMALRYFVAWVGTPLARGTLIEPLVQATVVGGITLALFALGIVAAWRKRSWVLNRGGWRDLHPWFMITGYGITSGLVTTAGRLALGVEQSIATRYVSFSCFILIGIIGTLAVLFARSEGSPGIKTRAGMLGFSAATVLLLVCFVFSWPDGWRAFRRHWTEELKMQIALRFVRLIPDNPQLGQLYPDPRHVRDIALPLLQADALHQAIVGTWILRKLDRPDGDDDGAFTATRDGSEQVISGWSNVVAAPSLPECIVVAAIGPNGAKKLVATALITGPEHTNAAGDRPARREFSIRLPDVSSSPDTRLALYSADLRRHCVFQLYPAR